MIDRLQKSNEKHNTAAKMLAICDRKNDKGVGSDRRAFRILDLGGNL